MPVSVKRKDILSMPETQGGPIPVKDAINSVKKFISDLFGSDQLRYATLEEVEFDLSNREWIVTMSITTPGAIVFSGTENRDYKVFKVDAETGQVTSMKMKQ
jgi:hypothetical protein